jgi:hypothetical protein
MLASNAPVLETKSSVGAPSFRSSASSICGMVSPGLQSPGSAGAPESALASDNTGYR